jgi:hypothetical protein
MVFLVELFISSPKEQYQIHKHCFDVRGLRGHGHWDCFYPDRPLLFFSSSDFSSNSLVYFTVYLPTRLLGVLHQNPLGIHNHFSMTQCKVTSSLDSLVTFSSKIIFSSGVPQYFTCALVNCMY